MKQILIVVMLFITISVTGQKLNVNIGVTHDVTANEYVFSFTGNDALANILAPFSFRLTVDEIAVAQRYLAELVEMKSVILQATKDRAFIRRNWLAVNIGWNDND